MSLLTETIKKREEFCSEKIKALKEKVINIKEINKQENYCIYATGSYARYEAAGNSDLDLFFVHSTESPVGNISKIIIDAALITIQREMYLPEFSGDGRFLEIHSLEKILNSLGSRDDDYYNFFSARMLLLLESIPIFNENYYQEVLVKIINAYYRDFHDHEENFKPLFLVNDIIRFWKTLCLNYEHARNRKPSQYGGSLSGRDEQKYKLKAHKNNLKLRFSRKMTCFSFLLKLISNYENLDQGHVLEIVKMRPIERLVSLTEENKSVEEDIEKALNLYTNFLELTSKPNDWMEQKGNRDFAFNQGREFGDCIFKVLSKLTAKNSEILKYIVS